jgi:hypothetical protein
MRKCIPYCYYSQLLFTRVPSNSPFRRLSHPTILTMAWTRGEAKEQPRTLRNQRCATRQPNIVVRIYQMIYFARDCSPKKKILCANCPKICHCVVQKKEKATPRPRFHKPEPGPPAQRNSYERRCLLSDQMFLEQIQTRATRP